MTSDLAVSRRRLLVDELDRRSAFRALEPAWGALLRRDAPAAGLTGPHPAGTSSPSAQGSVGPFMEPVWFAVLAGQLTRAPRALRLFVTHDQGRLAAALPLVAEDRRIGGVPARVLRSLSDDHSQRFDLAAEDDEAVAALWRALRDDETWDVLELRDVPDDSRRAGLLEEMAAAAGFPTWRWPSQRSPYLTLPGGSDLDALLDAKFRSNLKRRHRNLAKLGPVTLERLTAADGALDAALVEGFALERSGWKGARGTAIACDPALTARYRALARVFARRGELSLHFLRVGERRVAFHYAIESGGVYYLFKPGFDDELRKYGLGHLLTWEVARTLVERGARELDFLGEDMEWKREWTRAVRAHSWRYIFRPSLRGRALAAWKGRGIPLVKQVMAELRARVGRRLAARSETPSSPSADGEGEQA